MKKANALVDTTSPPKSGRVDKARAAKEGNRYHEAWLARRALELIFPRDGLAAIAVEGLFDERGLSQEAIEVADATFYFGDSHFKKACAIQIEQFKYSISRNKIPFRASDTTKTLAKFVKADSDLIAKHNRKSVLSKVRYGITTNRPIYKPFVEAITAASEGTAPKTKEGQEQLKQIQKITKLKASILKQFCKRLHLAGYGDTVTSVDRRTRRTIADWSASTDLDMKARIGSLKELIAQKAGITGQYSKTISKEDVLAVFDVDNDEGLLPTPQAFPKESCVVEREQLTDFLSKLKQKKLVLLHATGGLGKTVFVQSVAHKLSENNEVVLFDCFGGGQYRVPIDGRHKPERGLMHIVNELASRGLCDPILPGSSNAERVIETAIRRFSQAIDVIRRSRRNAQLVIILDAIDNAGEQADDLHQPSFPRLLFETLSLKGVPKGLILIGTCRSERKEKAVGEASCFPYPLEGFTLKETTELAKAIRPELTSAQIASIQHRTSANPRTIALLLSSAQPVSSRGRKLVSLDDLIQAKINTAIKEAQIRGRKKDGINAFLCALTWLPPPVPVDELACAFGQSREMIESFVSDLAPLLEYTRHGLIFRDEPTETLVRKQYGEMKHLLKDAVSGLMDVQDSSVYAARSLPLLLFAINDVSSLQTLAFDERFPASLTSEAAKRTIRMNRLRVAVAAAACARDADALTSLLVELSSVAIVHERGDDYFLHNPDLVMAIGDAEALRRLYESKKGWFGARPSRLAIAYILDGNIGEAHKEAVQSVRWLDWLYSKKENDQRRINPDIDDFAAWGLYLLANKDYSRLSRFLKYWTAEHGYKVSERILGLDRCAAIMDEGRDKTNPALRFALHKSCPSPYLASFLIQHISLPKQDRKRVIEKLAFSLRRTKIADRDFGNREESISYRDSVLYAAIAAFSYSMPKEARVLQNAIEFRRYFYHEIRNEVSPYNIADKILAITLNALLENRSINLFDCLPKELAELVEKLRCPRYEKDQKRVIIDAINDAAKQGQDPKIKPRVSSSDREEWTSRLQEKLTPIIMASNACAKLLLASTPRKLKSAVKAYFSIWDDVRALSRKQHYDTERGLGRIDQIFLNLLYSLMLAIDLSDTQLGELLLARIQNVKFKPPRLLTLIVARLALSSSTYEYSGGLAVDVVKAIKTLDDTTERSTSYAKLARAILPANKEEATQLFSNGYDELNAIGSNDFELVNELLLFASKLKRKPLGAETAHVLAKIVELSTLYESERFPWNLSAAAFSSAWGVDYLAQLTRWDDRDKISLDYTIGPAITRFVESGALSVREGFVLLSLVDPVETYGWRIEEYLEKALLSAPKEKEIIFSEYLDLLERKYHRSVPERELTELEGVSCKIAITLPASIAERVSCMRAQQAEPISYEKTGNNTVFDEKIRRQDAKKEAEGVRRAKAFAGKVKTVSVEAFEELTDKLDKIHGRLDLKTEAFKAIRETLSYQKRGAFINAIVEAKNLELFAKVSLLVDARNNWVEQSPTKLAFFKGKGLRLIELHAEELLGRDWGFLSRLKEIIEVSGDSEFEVATCLAKTAATKELTADATAWLSLAQLISDTAKPNIPKDALTRILSGEATRLASDIGDGSWQENLAVPKETKKIVAGVIWYVLGAPEITTRWVAAHTVRRVAKLGLWDVIDELFVQFSSKDAGAFQDRKLPFFHRHARLWFLTAIARIAIDFPNSIAKYQTFLEKILREDSLPHPAMQDAARRAIISAFNGKPIPKKTQALLDQVNKSPFSLSSKEDRDYPYERPKNIPAEDFHVEYDFNKYNVQDVGRIFALPDWKITDDMTLIIRNWDQKVKSMYDYEGKRQPPHNRYYSTQPTESFHSYGYYLAWHAIKILAGRYLKDRPIHQRYPEDDAWGEWLSAFQLTRKDGLWPSDGTDAAPRVAGVLLLVGTGKEAHPTDDKLKVSSLIGLDRNKIHNELMIDGDWVSSDSIHVRVSSALVSEQNAYAAGLAVATAPVLHAWLPAVDPYHEDFSTEPDRILEPWILHHDTWYRFDDNDPFMSKDVLKRACLSTFLNQRFQLQPEKVWNKTWSTRDKKVVLSSFAWGSRNGIGPRDDWTTGNSLVCDATFLKEVLSTFNKELLVLINLQHTKSYEHYRDLEDCDRWTQSNLVLTVDKQLTVRFVVPAAKDLKAIAGLEQYARCDFDKRYMALNHYRPEVGRFNRPDGRQYNC